MKKVRVKGTPHPKKTRALRDLTNQQIYREREGLRDRTLLKEAKNGASESPWVRLSSVHKRVAAISNKLDTMMGAAHRLGISEKITDLEVESFAAAMTEVESIFLKWEYILRTAAERSHTPLQKCSFPERDLTTKDLIAMEADDASETMFLSSSPLVSSSNPNSSPLFFTPSYAVPPRQDLQASSPTRAHFPTPHPVIMSRQSLSSSSCFVLTPASPSPPGLVWSFRSSVTRASAISPTPELDGLSNQSPDSSSSPPSSPKALRLFRPSMGSSCSSISTPPTSIIPCSPVDCMSPGLMTPLPPPELLLRYPSLGKPVEGTVQGKILHSLSPTPSFVTASASPILSTPAISQRRLLTGTDFPTPENVLQKDVSGGSPYIVDDLTASTVKRLGEKGLEEELWARLQLGSAAAHKFVRHRPLDTPSWEGSGRRNLNEYINSEIGEDRP